MLNFITAKLNWFTVHGSRTLEVTGSCTKQSYHRINLLRKSWERKYYFHNYDRLALCSRYFQYSMITVETREGFLRKNIVAVSFFKNCAIHPYSSYISCPLNEIIQA